MTQSPSAQDAGDTQRLDKWLWHARFARTRSAAARLVEDGHIRVNARRETTCAKRLRAGDVLTVALARDVLVIRVLGFAAHRGGAPVARALYEHVAAGDSVATEDMAPLLARPGQRG